MSVFKLICLRLKQILMTLRLISTPSHNLTSLHLFRLHASLQKIRSANRSKQLYQQTKLSQSQHIKLRGNIKECITKGQIVLVTYSCDSDMKFWGKSADWTKEGIWCYSAAMAYKKKKHNFSNKVTTKWKCFKKFLWIFRVFVLLVNSVPPKWCKRWHLWQNVKTLGLSQHAVSSQWLYPSKDWHIFQLKVGLWPELDSGSLQEGVCEVTPLRAAHMEADL